MSEEMYSTNTLYNQRVFVVHKKKNKLMKFGRLRSVVFHPHKAMAIGVIVKRPDIALMIKRKDKFVALDRLIPVENGFQVVDIPDSYDAEACKRLGVDFDQCILWDYMPIRTEDGTELGTINSVTFDAKTGEVDHVDLSGGINRKVLGSANLSVSAIKGFSDGAIIARAGTERPETHGGVADKAGEAWATAKYKSAKGAERVSDKAGDLADKAGEAGEHGAYKLGGALVDLKDKAVEGYHKITDDEPADTTAVTVQATVEDVKPAAQASKTQAGQSGQHTQTRAKTVPAEPQEKDAEDVGRAIGRQLGKASGMFKGFKEEFDKASHGK